ncbi:MAG: HupE/UreJ family protein [Verrucomicrobiota bacterium]
MLLALISVSTSSLSAHQPGLSYINLTVESNRLSGRVDMSLRDLDLVVNLDADGNGAVTFAELQAKQPAIGGYLLKHLTFSADGSPGLVHVREHLVATDNDGAFAVAEIDVDFPITPAVITIRNQLFFEVDASHRSLIQIGTGTNATPAIFIKDQPEQTFKLGEPRTRASFNIFFKEGVWHIWIGFDHILFLLALLLPSVLVLNEKKWAPVSDLKPAFFNVFKIVTAFTIAHSITLGLAASELIRLPSRFVESAIAASVVLAALNNIKPFFHGKGWLVAFCFGIIHGFGFATVLGELDLQTASLLTTLIGFNLGVEAGQLAIVAVFLPVAFSLRQSKAYQKGALVAGSAIIALLALVWLIERAFDISIIS